MQDLFNWVDVDRARLCMSQLLISRCHVFIICLRQKSILNGRLLLSHPIISLFVKYKCQRVEGSHPGVHFPCCVNICCSLHPVLRWRKVKNPCGIAPERKDFFLWLYRCNYVFSKYSNFVLIFLHLLFAAVWFFFFSLQC